MKKRTVTLLVFVVAALAFAGGILIGTKLPRQQQTAFYACVVENSDTILLVEGISENDINHRSQFDLHAQNTKVFDENGAGISRTDVPTGALVRVTYTGSVLETHPAGIPDVLLIEIIEREAVTDYRPMVYVGGRLHGDTGDSVNALPPNYELAGTIQKSVPQHQWMPREEFTSNTLPVGCEIFMDGSGQIYVKLADDSYLRYIVLQEELSAEAQEWLAWYNSLSPEEQDAVDYIPAELQNSPEFQVIDVLQ